MTVALVASALAAFDVVNSATPGILPFTAGSAANLVVAIVGWASSSDPPPACSYNGTLMQLVTAPLAIDADHGAAAIYSLPLNSSDNVVHDLRVQSTPNFAGYCAAYICSYSGTNQRLGQIIAALYGTHDAGVATGTTTFPALPVGSMVAFAGFTFFGNAPSDLASNSGWTQRGQAIAAHQSAFGYTANSTAGGDATIVLTSATPIYFALICIGYEVPITGTAIPSPDVTLTAAMAYRMGAFGFETVTALFDVQSADYLVVCVQRSSAVVDTITAAQIGSASYGGQELRFRPQFSDRDATISVVSDVAILVNPPHGSQTFSISGYQGNVGYVNVVLLGLSATSGVVGARLLFHGQGNAQNLPIGATKVGSRVIAFVAGPHTYNSMTASYGWETIAHIEEPIQLGTWVFSAIGGPDVSMIITPAAFSSFDIIAMEFQPALAVTPNVTGTGTILEKPLIQIGTAAFEADVTPNGQQFHAYHETWDDIPPKDPSMYQPDDFYLARLPAYLNLVAVSFAVPQCTYVDMNSNLKQTVGLNFPGTCELFKATLDLLRTRNPNIKVVLAIQQSTPEASHNMPYDPAGWGGVTDLHLAAFNRFIADMNLDGIILDYEVLIGGEHQELQYHCQTIDGLRVCYTDTELIWVVKTFRAAIARPLTIFLDCQHVGAYGQGDFTFSPPGLGWNTGYNLALSRDAEAVACLDALHLMTYDAGGGYDPRQAVRAYKFYFPNTPLYLGIRVGPPDYENVKITARQFRDFANTTIKLGLAGGHMYSTMWDVSIDGRLNPQFDPPYGNYNADFPDGNIAGAIFARTYGGNYGSYPRLNNRKLMRGLFHPL